MAGITITYVMGNNSVFKQAQDAKNKTEQAKQEEQEHLGNLGSSINNYGNGTAKPPITAKFPKGEIVKKDKEEYVDENGDKAPIPGGFCVAQDSKDDPTDKNTIENGLVISDVAGDDLDNSKHGNQFVWIPVPDYSKFHLIEGYYNGSLQTNLSRASSPSREAGDPTTAGSPGKPNSANSVKGTPESIAMYQSVKENKGFYIARFEAGIEGVLCNTYLSPRTPSDGSVKPLSQKGVGVWNSISWGGTSSDIASDGLPGDDNSDGAVKVSRSMYPASDTVHKVTSTLCYGVQWDAVLNFIDSTYITGKSTGYVKDSTGKGNFSETHSTTGSNIAYQQNHIYDMAGNVDELTMEAYNTNRRVSRGNNYSNSPPSKYPVSIRFDHSPDDSSSWSSGFRVTLYL